MSRRILLLFLVLFFASAISVHAQGRRDEFVWQDAQPIYHRPEPPWIADMRPNPRFPVTVRLQLERRYYDGIKFVGGGWAHIFNPIGENLEFKYRCEITPRSALPLEFYGRWVKPGRKLEIALRDPNSNHTRTCRISILPPPTTATNAAP